MGNNSAHRVSLSFQLLKTFTEKEIEDFEKLINSGYLTDEKSLAVLLKNLKKYALDHEEFSSDIKKTLCKTLYGEENQKKKLSKAMNDLLREAEKFLMFEKIKKTNQHDPLLLFPELIDRKQLLLFNRRINATEKKLSNDKNQGVEYHNHCYEIQREKNRVLFINNVLVKEDNYDLLQYHSDVKYLLQKLQYHLAKITLQRRYANKIFNLKPFTSLKALLGLPEYQSNPLIQLYVLNIQLVESEEEATFLALSKLLKEKQDVIPEDFLKPFYTNLTNYCIYQVLRGDLNFYKYLFNIYNDMHEANLLTKNKNIELVLLKNVITNACRVKAFSWAMDKLNHYIEFVPVKVRDSVFEYNSGIIAFNQQKYELALNHFSKVTKIDDIHELSLRIEQLKCFYETDTFYKTETQQMIDSLKTYIHQNKKLAGRQKIAYLNFIRIFHKLYKFKDIPDRHTQEIIIKKTLPKLKDRLKHFDLINEKQWLLLKIISLQ